MAHPVLQFPERYDGRDEQRTGGLARAFAVADTQAAAIRIAAEVEQEIARRRGRYASPHALHRVLEPGYQVPTIAEALRTLLHVVRLRVSRRLHGHA